RAFFAEVEFPPGIFSPFDRVRLTAHAEQPAVDAVDRPFRFTTVRGVDLSGAALRGDVLPVADGFDFGQCQRAIDAGEFDPQVASVNASPFVLSGQTFRQ